jgi:hypothetical protein
MKKMFCIAIFFVLCATALTQNSEALEKYLAKNTETIKFFAVNQRKYITLRAVFIGWTENYRSISHAGTIDAQLKTYERFQPSEELAAIVGEHQEWSEWELLTIFPADPYATSAWLRIAFFDTLYDDWKKESITGLFLSNSICIFVAPKNKSLPFWFDEDSDLHSFSKTYLFQ